MSKKYFVSYGDTCYKESLERIGREAETLHLFDNVILYTDRSLPEPFSGYARKYKRGGGYWMWKPWVVWHTLEQMEEGDVLVYADAGCSLFSHPDWGKYFHRLANSDAVFFVAEGKNKKWCKRMVFDSFTPKCQLWRHAHQIQATFFLVKKTHGNEVVRRWYEAAIRHPEFFVDASKEEAEHESSAFKEHRHDQSVLTACVCTDSHLHNICFLPEKMEKVYGGGQALIASRISSAGMRGRDKSCPPVNKWMGKLSLCVAKPVQIKITRCLFRLSQFLNS